MIRLALALWVLLAAAAAAQTVRVASGEHDGFSRLVLTLPGPADWRLTRTEDGYALAVDRPDLRYDLSDVFRLIPRTRLVSIFADPADGALRLGIGCACYALPFELQPGIIVIDLRDGPPPEGSSFETAAGGDRLPPLAARAAPRPRSRPGTVPDAPVPAAAGYDWLADWRAAPDKPALPAGLLPEAMAAAGAERAQAEALRGQILGAMARGAAQGLVTLEPGPGVAGARLAGGDGLGQVRIGGGALAEDAAAAAPLDRDGRACLPDAAVDLGAWGDARPAAQWLGEARTAVVGEFDRPDPAAAERLVRAYLYMGFGREAAQAAAAFAPAAPDIAVWQSLARILDGYSDPGGAFAGMEACDTWAALWAVLALPDLPAGAGRQDGAVLRAFSALPPHLRRHLGPGLGDRYVAAGLDSPARAIRDAILRAPGDPGDATRLFDLGLRAATGAPAPPGGLETLAAVPGETGLRATIAAIGAAAAAGAVPMEMILAAEGLRRIHDGTPAAADLDAAIALGRATQGDFAGAFALAPPDSAAAQPVWQVLADRGGIADVLDHAAGPVPPGLGDDTALALARRLLDLGLAEAALPWTAGRGDAGALLAAEAELSRGDAIAAVRALEGVADPAAMDLRARALAQIDPAARPDDLSAQLARRDWAALAAEGPAPWQAAAARLPLPDDLPAAGTLARGRALLSDSASTRGEIEALLAATALAAPPGGE